MDLVNLALELRGDHGRRKFSNAGRGEAGVKRETVTWDFPLSSVSEGYNGVTGMPKVNGVGAVGCIKKIKLLEHRIFARGGRLEGINLSACCEENYLS